MAISSWVRAWSRLLIRRMEHGSDFLNATRWISHVYDGVAVRADRPQVFNRVDFILRSDRCQGPNVVDMNEAQCRGAIVDAEVEATGNADCAVSFNTTSASDRISFVCVDSDLSHRALYKLFSLRNFVWQRVTRCCESAGLKSRNDLCRSCQTKP